MTPQVAAVLALGAGLLLLMFLATWLLDQVALFRRERDEARVDAAELRALLRAHGVNPPPPPPGGGKL